MKVVKVYPDDTYEVDGEPTLIKPDVKIPRATDDDKRNYIDGVKVIVFAGPSERGRPRIQKHLERRAKEMQPVYEHTLKEWRKLVKSFPDSDRHRLCTMLAAKVNMSACGIKNRLRIMKLQGHEVPNFEASR